MPPAKRKPAAKKPVVKAERIVVQAPTRKVTELLVWRAEIWPFGMSRAIDFFTEDGEHFRVCGINDETAASLVAMLSPQPDRGPVVA